MLARHRFPSGRIGFEAFENRQRYELRWAGAARALVPKTGLRARVIPQPNARPITLAVLRHIVAAYASSLRGVESLHATVVSNHHGAIALLGPSGEGKSTLARHFMMRGWTLHTDDILYLRFSQRSVWPARRRAWFKVAPESALRARGDRDYDPNFGKRITLLPPPKAAKPIRAFIRLSRRRACRIHATPVSPSQAALHLMANAYNDILCPPPVLARQFRWSARLAQAVPLWQLEYPSGTRHLGRIELSLANLLKSLPR